MHKTIEFISPCYNPGHEWASAYIERINELCQMLGTDIKTYWTVVNDGSRTDFNTGAEYLKAHLPAVTILSYADNKGKGFAIRHAVNQSLADVIVYTDIDVPYTAESILDLIRPLIDNTADVTLGRRTAEYYRSIPFIRNMVSRSLLWMNRVILRLKHPDTQCGLKAFRKEVAPLFLQTTLDGFLFEVQFVKLLESQSSFRIQPIPVVLRTQIELSNLRFSSLITHLNVFLQIFMKRK